MSFSTILEKNGQAKIFIFNIFIYMKKLAFPTFMTFEANISSKSHTATSLENSDSLCNFFLNITDNSIFKIWIL